jgi:hypothetical protein
MPQALADRLEQLAADEAAYEAMLAWKQWPHRRYPPREYRASAAVGVAAPALSSLPHTARCLPAAMLQCPLGACTGNDSCHVLHAGP